MSDPERSHEELGFDPVHRWIELSMPDGTPDNEISRALMIVADHFFQGPRLEGGFEVFGTRIQIIADVEGDNDLGSDDELTEEEVWALGFVAAIDSPHAHLRLQPMDF